MSKKLKIKSSHHGRTFLLFNFFLLFFISVHGQQKIIPVNGKVLTAENNPLTGVSVQVRGTSRGTSTNEQGEFSINANKGDILIFSIIGYNKKEIKADGNNIDIVLDKNNSSLADVVVIGYGTQKKGDLTSAISSVSGKKLEGMPVQNTESLLQGQVAGLTVTSDGGEPGDNGKVRIRGVGTFGNNSPLFVVDGIPVNNGLNFLNPQDIETIQVFKDAAAAAIYGNRAANGVVYITTKKGHSGKRQISLDAYYGTAKNGKVRRMANAKEFFDYVTLKNENGPLADLYSKGYNTNWVDAISRTAQTQNYNLSIRGGNDDHTYFTSVNYSKALGTQLRSDNERFTARLNSTHKIFEWLKFGEDLDVSNETRHNNNVYGQARNVPSIVPIYKTQALIDSLSPADRSLDQYFDVPQAINILNNPVAQTMRSNGTNHWLSLYGNAQGTIDIGKIVHQLDGLKFTSTIGFERIDNDYHSFSPIFALGGREYSNKTGVNDNFNKYFHWTFNNFLAYNKSFGKHTIGVTAGTVAEQETASYFGASASTGISNDPYLQVLDAQTADRNNGGSQYRHAYASYVGRVNYNYDDRYLLQASIRRDGSYRFAADKRWGTFPSVGLGWRVSNEKFFKDLNLKNVSDLKFRGSWGQLGNEKIQADFPYLSQIAGTVNRGYVLGGVGGDNSSKVFVQGYGPTNAPNPDLTWETTASTNIGADLALFDNKLRFSVDYFSRYTTNVLYQKTLPLYSGVPAADGIAPVTQWVNGAEIKNHGVEFTVNYTANIGRLGLDVDANISSYKASVYKLNDNIPIQVNDERIPTVIQMKQGDPLGAFYGYIVDGFYNTPADLLNKDGNERQQGAQVGDFKFRDTNGDGIIDAKDKTVIGNPNPKFTYAFNLNFNYAGFDLRSFWTGSYGNKIYSIGDIYLSGWDEGGPQNIWADVVANSWTPDHTNAIYPKVSAGGTKRNFEKGPVSTSLQNGSYFRLKNLQIGYTFSDKNLKKIGFSGLRVYLSGENLFVITKYKGDDPEVGNGVRLNANEGGQGNSPSYIMGLDYGDRYPIQKTITAGVSVQF
ncbi:MAG: TonB-dependent receptor [Bacteroidota bacterium]|nr:TonB-dependent receptor [Bacteroidota bacterium]